jgi:hypothetical protein
MTGKNCVAIASDLRFGINQQQTTAGKGWHVSHRYFASQTTVHLTTASPRNQSDTPGSGLQT